MSAKPPSLEIPSPPVGISLRRNKSVQWLALAGVGWEEDAPLAYLRLFVWRRGSWTIQSQILGAKQIVENASSLAQQQHSVRGLTGQLVDPSRPGDFNQTTMELGETLCSKAKLWLLPVPCL
uniref:Uncharacterized protein n=1 Tax=Oryza punctata TaxID=4537 RepID=A0A0E0MKQ6_ORYPU